jgi:ribonuclease HI
MAWRRVKFKGGVVLARCEEDGTLRSEGGRVEIRYRPTDTRAYRAGMRNLAMIDGEPVLPDDTCPQGEPVAARNGSAGASKATGRSKAKGSGARAGTSLETPPDGAIVAWTDGACSGNPGPAGLGVVLLDGDRRRELSEYLGKATNNIAELTAIGRALEAIGDGHDGRPVRVYTDSQYSIGVLTKGWKAKANQELVAHLRSLTRRFSDLELIYVRGHVGIELNERADALAVQAVQDRESTEWIEI